MTAQESRIIGSMDRRRETAEAKEARTMRDRAIEAYAKVQARSFIGLNDAERASFAKHLVRFAREDLMVLIDAPGAAAFLSAEAGQASKGILPQAISRARAEQLFSANDKRGENAA